MNRGIEFGIIPTWLRLRLRRGGPAGRIGRSSTALNQKRFRARYQPKIPAFAKGYGGQGAKKYSQKGKGAGIDIPRFSATTHSGGRDLATKADTPR